MKIALSSDEHAPLIDFILAYLIQRQHKVNYLGPHKGAKAANWPQVTQAAAKRVATQQAKQGICLCWTGTGACIAARRTRRFMSR
ncbi:RpiB/LacA/LacB family sugar-phosphate isomerase [Shewanella surugensis]|uniref:RpiB/LacA/LacB family sugar-phosphate isomerase n=1 Tax=Shewanella surugensis TaxID=212020 RepID=A0ABT0LGX0_9GAMM|nr:RpiB/LacA/LacB family sugar-phosphate isomerase [Shewanella surugensis]MCL1126411.1 RpiB/LacA/LacB family sugar-phosphate isomerase [Shewanella surugensis]